MLTVLTVLLFTLVLTSCKKKKHYNRAIDGVWKGTFERQGSIDPGTAQVTLELLDHGFNGTTDRENYPAICNGTFYIQSGDKAVFENKCAWTANFEWTYILNGDYEISKTGDSLYITRTIGDFTDVYKLKKQ